MNEGMLMLQKKRVLVLVSNEKIFNVVKNKLEARGCEVLEDPECTEDLNFVFLDSFFLFSSEAEFLKEEFFTAPIVHLSYGIKRCGEIGVGDCCYDHLFIPSFEMQKAETRIASWMATPKALHLFDRLPKEFGLGLWTDLMRQFGYAGVDAFACRQSA